MNFLAAGSFAKKKWFLAYQLVPSSKKVLIGPARFALLALLECSYYPRDCLRGSTWKRARACGHHKKTPNDNTNIYICVNTDVDYIY